MKCSHGSELPHNVNTIHTFAPVVASWSKAAFKLPKDMTIAQCTASSGVPWPMPLHGDSLSMSQMYKNAMPKKINLKYTTLDQKKAPLIKEGLD